MILFFKGFLGLHNIEDGSTCEFSKRYWDVHDYHKHKGGNGYPFAFYVYKCSKCGKFFSI
jgi:hypothetical protein